MPDPDSLDKTLYQYKTTPYYGDGCGHGGYLFSFTCIERSGQQLTEANYDVYCFESRGKQEFCLRYGDDAPDYCSPGNVQNLVQYRHSLERYDAVVKLLNEIGTIVFVADKPE